ncbi:pantoate--beta-alanine ligase [Plastoroseomonas hellenica]|uniref:pantoate--beta-alanine ligase n=1 Tax=Plastoroseomonas hellenica TaxID=2687306 RepID=UPI001BAC93B0|nr:pantoate--beta-alanine ligase [Plastoroseomonas hellenica]MBR0644608.1 pantoate--beta-alanine ligase [Plastoroseomonas hellenica]
MRIVRDLPALRAATKTMRRAGERVALVPTMGALHAGHLALVEAARREADRVITSIFVNPLQFGPNEDFSKYPRTEEADLTALEAAGCDIAWLPTVEVMYPPGAATVIEVAGPTEGFEGVARPGHFRGVATVCCKLFSQTEADVAVFGEKDWQQLQVIRRMVADLDLPLGILGHPIVRDANGLALSSRNRYLSPAERAKAAMLPEAMREAANAMLHGAAIESALDAARDGLNAAGFDVNYLALVEPETLRPTDALPARMIAAAKLGPVRLLDNMPVG